MNETVMSETVMEGHFDGKSMLTSSLGGLLKDSGYQRGSLQKRFEIQIKKTFKKVQNVLHSTLMKKDDTTCRKGYKLPGYEYR